MIKVSVEGESELITKFQNLPATVLMKLDIEIAKTVYMLQSYIQSDKLSGQVLKTKTGTLRRSIATKTFQAGNMSWGVVGTNSNYGLAHEFGFKGSETVQAHLRTIKQAFGHSITPKAIQIRQFTRNVDMPERSFLRSALADKQQEIIINIDNAVLGALNES